VFRSTDGGLTWTAPTTQPTNRPVLALAASGGTFWAGSDGDGVFRSTDGGLNWTPVGEGRVTTLSIWSLAVSGTDLLAGAEEAGIWRFGL
jgi:photosystem II stability/assembly factor-like uncharacterized protein